MAFLIRSTRRGKGLSQKYVGKALGLSSPQFISNWERGIASPPMRHWKRLRQILGIDNDMLKSAYFDDRSKEVDDTLEYWEIFQGVEYGE